MSFAIYISHTVPDFYQIHLKKCETTKLNRGRNKIRACCLPSSCHQTRCFLEEWETCSGSWSDRARCATLELCPALTPLTLDLFIQISPLHTSISLRSASVPILSVPHILSACTLAPLSPPSPGQQQRLSQEHWVTAMAIPSHVLLWQGMGHRVGRQGRGHKARKFSAGVLSEC